MDTYNIAYKWEHGVFEIEDMIRMVNNKILSKEQFFEITRYNYDGVVAASVAIVWRKMCGVMFFST